jgi:hypothetical protein
MVQPHRSNDGASSGHPDDDWLAVFIREHIAKGNRPDHAQAQKLARELNELAAAHEPLGLNDDEIVEFARELCAGRSGDEILARASARAGRHEDRS